MFTINIQRHLNATCDCVASSSPPGTPISSPPAEPLFIVWCCSVRVLAVNPISAEQRTHTDELKSKVCEGCVGGYEDWNYLVQKHFPVHTSGVTVHTDVFSCSGLARLVGHFGFYFSSIFLLFLSIHLLQRQSFAWRQSPGQVSELWTLLTEEEECWACHCKCRLEAWAGRSSHFTTGFPATDGQRRANYIIL